MENIPGIWFPKIYETTKEQERLSEISVFEHMDNITFKSDFANKSYPFILKNAFNILPKREAISTLMNKCSNQIINVRFGNMSNPTDYINRRTADMDLKSFIENHFLQPVSTEIAYAGSSPVDDDFLNALDVKYPKFYPVEFFNQPRLWFGKAGTITPLHKDIPDNFACNYFGTKKWIIYPPKDFLNLYMVNPHPEEVPDFGASQVNIKNVDWKLYPNFKNAASVEFILEQGDMLYLPAGWTHYVENTEDTLMINFWLKREKSPAILGNDI